MFSSKERILQEDEQNDKIDSFLLEQLKKEKSRADEVDQQWINEQVKCYGASFTETYMADRPHVFSVEEVKQIAAENQQDIVLVDPFTMVENHVALERRSKESFEATLKGKKS